jgi:tetratricopeptide (TPR) repeat protein
MKTLDKHYLLLQFRLRIYTFTASEYQSFFENIMEKAFPKFQKVRPYGNVGDAGNDGFIEEEGVYYQVYSPKSPKDNELKAAKKMEADFLKLQSGWDKISRIRRYYFVYNDKFTGTVLPFNESRSRLKKNNPKIKFELFFSKNLEEIFFSLDESDILALGFTIDQRQAISNAKQLLDAVRLNLDRGIVKNASIMLENIKESIVALEDNELLLEYEILHGKCLQKGEKVIEARELFENISKRFRNDIRPYLYIAEIFLNERNFEKNKEYLEKANEIDPKSWHLELEQMNRKLRLGEDIEITDLDTLCIPENPRIISNFYRLYGLIFESKGDSEKSDKYIEIAISQNGDDINNYIAKLLLQKYRLLSCQDPTERRKIAKILLEEVNFIENQFNEFGEMINRNSAVFNTMKFIVALDESNAPEIERISNDTFTLLINCYFDAQIETVIEEIFSLVTLPKKKLDQLLSYINTSKLVKSDGLSKVLIFQFDNSKVLFTEGKEYFKSQTNIKYLIFIENLEENNEEEIIKFVDSDVQFIVMLSNVFKYMPSIRNKVIEKIPNNIDILRVKLSLLLNYEEKDYEEAFQIIQQLDLSTCNYLECRSILHIIHNKKAYDFEEIVIKKLLEHETQQNNIQELKIQLLYTYHNLKKFKDLIDIGEELLAYEIGPDEKETLLSYTINACFERGKIDIKELKRAKDLLELHHSEDYSYEYYIGVKAEVYLKDHDYINALKSIVDGVKHKKILTPHEYANLHSFLIIKFGDKLNIDLESLETVEQNTYIKFINDDQWYFIGDDNELDTIKINNKSKNYLLFMSKKKGEIFVIDRPYSSTTREYCIEKIYSIEKYIIWQSTQYFQRLSADDLIPGVQAIDMPQDNIEFRTLNKYFEDINKQTQPLFDLYCMNSIPLAFLAVSEGGFVNAIGRIQHEKKGFINFSIGSSAEAQEQLVTAGNIISNALPFYIDGTSAFVLSEQGMLKNIITYIPNIRVPQSVVFFLSNILERVRYSEGQVGHLNYIQGKVTFSSIDKSRSDKIVSNIVESIILLESNPKNICVISSANKLNSLAEKKYRMNYVMHVY